MRDVSDDYRTLNLSHWNDRASAHASSPGYQVDRLIADPRALSRVVAFDVPRLGDLTGLRGVHLQCHIGTDTLSLTRLGARMSGLDFSGESLAQARRLAAAAGADIDYVQADVYDALQHFEPASFDLVFTGVGALCWLPRIEPWADVVVGLLKPGGRLFLREGHPMLWALDEEHPDLLPVAYDYFERPEPLVYESSGTYVETEATFAHNTTHTWNHGIGEIVTALLRRGMRLTMLQEHNSVPWEGLPGKMTRGDDHEWRLTERPWRVACSYTLQAVRES